MRKPNMIPEYLLYKRNIPWLTSHLSEIQSYLEYLESLMPDSYSWLHSYIEAIEEAIREQKEKKY